MGVRAITFLGVTSLSTLTAVGIGCASDGGADSPAGVPGSGGSAASAGSGASASGGTGASSSGGSAASSSGGSGGSGAAGSGGSSGSGGSGGSSGSGGSGGAGGSGGSGGSPPPPPDNDIEDIQDRLNAGAVSIGGMLLDPEPLSDGSEPQVEGVTDWLDGARAGYSMIHDDICDFQMGGTEDHWEEGADRGLSVGWGVIVSRCGRPGYKTDSALYWDLVKEMEAKDQEIINHSWTHPNIYALSQCSVLCQDEQSCKSSCPAIYIDSSGDLRGTPAELRSRAVQDMTLELLDSGTEIGANNTTGKPVFYAFPLDLADDNILQMLKDDGLFGARGGDRNVQGTLNGWDVDTGDPLADFRITFDAYNEDTDGATRHGENGLDHALSTYLNEAVKEGKWGLRELHSIRPDFGEGGHGWGPVTLQLYRQHLDNVKCRVDARQVWMDQSVELVKYRRVRAHCGEPVLAGDTLSFSDAANADCQKYQRPVTVSIQGDSSYALSGASGADSYTNLPGGRVLVNLTPGQTATLSVGGSVPAPATSSCATFTNGAPPGTGPSDCAPITACQCDEDVPAQQAGASGQASICANTTAATTLVMQSWNLSYCGKEAGQCDGANVTMSGGGGSITLNGRAGSAGDKTSSGWGIQPLWTPPSLDENPRACADGSSFQGVRVCAQGAIKNGFPVTRFVPQGDYSLSDTDRETTEQQQVLWVYLLNELTRSNRDQYTPGTCDATDESLCTMPFFPITISPDSQTCADIAWSDFEFPYWWGAPNEGYFMPDECAPAGSPPPDSICYAASDYEPDPAKQEQVARYRACDEMAKGIIGVITAAVDDVGTEPVSVENLQISVSFY